MKSEKSCNWYKKRYYDLSKGMDYGASRPSTGFESGAPMIYGHSISGSGSEASGGSAGMGGKPRFAFKTNTTGGTTTRSAHRDFGVLGYNHNLE